MKSVKLAVIGGGLVGSSVFRLALNFGIDAYLIDKPTPESASKAAAGVWRPEWFKKFEDLASIGLEALAELGIHPEEMEFEYNYKGKTRPWKLQFVNPRKILMDYDRVSSSLYSRELVTSLVFDESRKTWKIGCAGSSRNDIEAENVLVAAGHLLPQLLTLPKELGFQGRSGMALEFNTPWEGPPRATMWRPYCHAMAFQRDPGSSYFSDGQSVKNWSSTHEEGVFKRASDFGLLPTQGAFRGGETLFGVRPYTKVGAVLEHHSPGLSYITGTAKNGTVLGPALALEYLEGLLEEA